MRRAGWLVVVLVLATSVGTLVPADDGGLSRDSLGWEDGYAYDEPVSVTVADGLNESERAAVTARAMARVERIRGLEFREPVDVQVRSRADYLASRNATGNATHRAWNNQVWEALFLVGDDRDVGEVLSGTVGASVVGYYEPGSGDVVLVSDSETPTVSRGTLVHELVHALQDQHFGLADRPDTQDAQLARNGVVEGEANRIQGLYQQRCGRTWSCVDPAAGASGGGSGNQALDRGVFLVIYHPYAAGPDFVEAIASRGGSDALDDLYDDFPPSTEGIIHPERYPEEQPVTVTVPDRSSEEWKRFDHDPVADTVGEASIYAMVVDNGLGDPPAGRYSYEHPVSDGWAGDSVVPYRAGDRRGYVWELAWDSDRDADEFVTAYRDLLAQHDAESLGDGRYRIPAASSFGGGYRVTREGTTVRIVNGPSVAALDEIHDP